MTDITGAIYQMQGEFFFIPHPPGKRGKQERIEKTRLRVYYGSRMHFLRTLYSGDLREQGYYINPDFYQGPIPISGDMDSWQGIKLVYLDPEGYPDKLLIYPEKPMLIDFFEDNFGKPVDLTRDKGSYLMPSQSKLTFGSKKCVVLCNGTTFDYSFSFSGYIGGQRVATMLPDDFMPDD